MSLPSGICWWLKKGWVLMNVSTCWQDEGHVASESAPITHHGRGLERSSFTAVPSPVWEGHGGMVLKRMHLDTSSLTESMWEIGVLSWKSMKRNGVLEMLCYHIITVCDCYGFHVGTWFSHGVCKPAYSVPVPSPEIGRKGIWHKILGHTGIILALIHVAARRNLKTELFDIAYSER